MESAVGQQLAVTEAAWAGKVTDSTTVHLVHKKYSIAIHTSRSFYRSHALVSPLRFRT